MNRRRAILAVVGLSVGVPGCSNRGSREERIDLTVFNQADGPYTVEIGFYGDGDSREAARAYAATLDIDGGGQTTREGVVDSGRYLVSYSVYEDDSRQTDESHVHYIPSEADTDGLVLDVQETGEITRR